MSRSRRPSNNGNNNANNSNGNANGGGRGANKGARHASTRDFWGTGFPPPEPADTVTMAEDATAMVRSLGTPPLTGQEAVAEHYFTAVYVKAAALASALAAADGLLETEPSMSSGL
jgi:hypothetical protein